MKEKIVNFTKNKLSFYNGNVKRVIKGGRCVLTRKDDEQGKL